MKHFYLVSNFILQNPASEFHIKRFSTRLVCSVTGPIIATTKYKPNGRRKAGRPKLRWLDSIENDLESMGAKRWRKKAEGRSVWAVILKGAVVKL
jgi:hypothetical protein